ncbi:MAG: DUF6266 family protein [Bacteroidota bacterium]
MGRALWGTSGGFRGKNGANIGRWVGGQNIVGPLPHPSLKPATTPQLNVRFKFGLTTGFLGMVSPLIRIGFNDARENKESAFSAAVSYNIRNAITGTAPAYVIDYPKVLFSKGPLENPISVTMATTEDAQLDLSWSTYGVVKGQPTDLLTFVVYNPAKQLFVVVKDAAARSVLSYELALPVEFSGDSVHVYVLMISADGKVVSKTKYIGETEVQ